MAPPRTPGKELQRIRELRKSPHQDDDDKVLRMSHVQITSAFHTAGAGNNITTVRIISQLCYLYVGEIAVGIELSRVSKLLYINTLSFGF
jgi:hypothetical protein